MFNELWFFQLLHLFIIIKITTSLRRILEKPWQPRFIPMTPPPPSPLILERIFPPIKRAPSRCSFLPLYSSLTKWIWIVTVTAYWLVTRDSLTNQHHFLKTNHGKWSWRFSMTSWSNWFFPLLPIQWCILCPVIVRGPVWWGWGRTSLLRWSKCVGTMPLVKERLWKVAFHLVLSRCLPPPFLSLSLFYLHPLCHSMGKERGTGLLAILSHTTVPVKHDSCSLVILFPISLYTRQSSIYRNETFW